VPADSQRAAHCSNPRDRTFPQRFPCFSDRGIWPVIMEEKVLQAGNRLIRAANSASSRIADVVDGMNGRSREHHRHSRPSADRRLADLKRVEISELQSGREIGTWSRCCRTFHKKIAAPIRFLYTASVSNSFPNTKISKYLNSFGCGRIHWPCRDAGV